MLPRHAIPSSAISQKIYDIFQASWLAGHPNQNIVWYNILTPTDRTVYLTILVNQWRHNCSSAIRTEPDPYFYLSWLIKFHAAGSPFKKVTLPSRPRNWTAIRIKIFDVLCDMRSSLRQIGQQTLQSRVISGAMATLPQSGQSQIHTFICPG